jgi:hypothetical protein
MATAADISTALLASAALCCGLESAAVDEVPPL